MRAVHQIVIFDFSHPLHYSYISPMTMPAAERTKTFEEKKEHCAEETVFFQKLWTGRQTDAIFKWWSRTRSPPIKFAAPGGVPHRCFIVSFFIHHFTLDLPRGPRLGPTSYAEDVAVWASAQSPSAVWLLLQPTLDALILSGSRWRLTFSAEKTQAAFFCRRQRWLDNSRIP